ncbi:hypothetical protein M441DRAFT_59270 [Trichoderma asperellum CBS 433.97]|uniref:Uncharacterized protein n=1 Tax=Trichoderma asperellum (strain ATCC 204424 / CBS 433.97 / NBRC 101777) TaxID=1042311 RepID=A0A2T3Z2Y6_TRIA4|nr:hypothetical protein M441DRAFT_59270 [Trichoderma asperellum CBS 433.97]PTB39181.1 hypothetical protein M441DRAFT_59270 [Trichoderma asperellum CBS 433.97]
MILFPLTTSLSLMPLPTQLELTSSHRSEIGPDPSPSRRPATHSPHIHNAAHSAQCHSTSAAAEQHSVPASASRKIPGIDRWMLERRIFCLLTFHLPTL